MTGRPQTFHRSNRPEPHLTRSKAILEKHPEIRRLIGHNPYTLVWIVALLTVQISLARWAGGVSWWAGAAMAYVCGSFVAHGLIMLIHDCAHGLVLQKRWANVVAGIVANLGTVLPSAASVRRYHLKHHVYQGVVALDVDMPGRWEARVVGNGVLRKVLWMLLFPAFMAVRPLQLREIKALSGWVVLNAVVVLAADAAVWALFGAKAFAYLVESLFFGLGLHPLGGRWIQEHFVLYPPQETYSYYGPLNLVSFNIGYHNEHHDFPGVPWNRVPQIRRLAPEWYDSLVSYRSWTKLLIRFLFDPELTLFTRMGRTDRGERSLESRLGPGLA
jgi:sphingolipid 4-desaturase/C4-monooxygenase